MKANEAAIGRALDAPGGWRIALLHGPDEGASRMLADRLAVAMGTDAERVDLASATLKADPALLTDEATAIAMFGGARWIRVTGGDEILPAVDALLTAPAGCPVIIIAPQLKPASPLLKLATASPEIIAFASWKLAGDKADAVALQLARPLGLKLQPDAARMVADATGGDRALMLRELEKLALYVDAAPDRPRMVVHADVDAVGAALDVREAWDLVDALFTGRSQQLATELSGSGVDVIPSLRAVGRRALALARAQAALPSKTFMAREKTAVDQQVRHADTRAVVAIHTDVVAIEAAIKRSPNAGEVVAYYDLLRLGRAMAQ